MEVFGSKWLDIRFLFIFLLFTNGFQGTKLIRKSRDRCTTTTTAASTTTTTTTTTTITTTTITTFHL